MVFLVATFVIFALDNNFVGTDEKPTLKNLIVDFGNPEEDNFGDFPTDFDEKVFLEFGAHVSGPNGEDEILPTFEYIVKTDAKVKAAADGYMTDVMYQPETQDYEIITRPTKWSLWTVSYDHVTNLMVEEGDFVKAGQTIGNPGTWDGKHGRVELMVSKIANGESHHVCPFEFFDKKLVKTYESKILEFMNVWESIKERKFYTYEMYRPGCNYKTILEKNDTVTVLEYK